MVNISNPPLSLSPPSPRSPFYPPLSHSGLEAKKYTPTASLFLSLSLSLLYPSSKEWLPRSESRGHNHHTHLLFHIFLLHFFHHQFHYSLLDRSRHRRRRRCRGRVCPFCFSESTIGKALSSTKEENEDEDEEEEEEEEEEVEVEDEDYGRIL